MTFCYKTISIQRETLSGSILDWPILQKINKLKSILSTLEKLIHFLIMVWCHAFFQWKKTKEVRRGGIEEENTLNISKITIKFKTLKGFTLLWPSLSQLPMKKMSLWSLTAILILFLTLVTTWMDCKGWSTKKNWYRGKL